MVEIWWGSTSAIETLLGDNFLNLHPPSIRESDPSRAFIILMNPFFFSSSLPHFLKQKIQLGSWIQKGLKHRQQNERLRLSESLLQHLLLRSKRSKLYCRKNFKLQFPISCGSDVFQYFKLEILLCNKNVFISLNQNCIVSPEGVPLLLF